MKKYELTDATLVHCGHTLHCIKSLVTIPGVVKAGNLGGWIESEENLSHDGECWVYDDAKVFDNAKVFGKAKVCDKAKVYGNAKVRGAACVSGSTRVYGNAIVCGNAHLYDGEITGAQDYACHGPVGSRNDFVTLNKTTGTVCTGCFCGTLDEFEKAVRETHGDNKYGIAYKGLIAYFKTLINQ